MSEGEEGATETTASEPTPVAKIIGKPFQKGRSGNPSGRPKIEPRVRRFARRYDRAMCRTLAELATDKTAPPSERYPDAELHLKKHDGRAEALLIARYAALKAAA